MMSMGVMVMRSKVHTQHNLTSVSNCSTSHGSVSSSPSLHGSVIDLPPVQRAERVPGWQSWFPAPLSSSHTCISQCLLKRLISGQFYFRSRQRIHLGQNRERLLALPSRHLSLRPDRFWKGLHIIWYGHALTV